MSETYFNGELADQFAERENTVRFFVRYEMAHLNLAKLAGGEPLKVADVGGGSGPDTAWLAGLGHQVDLIEPAHDQLTLAKSRLASYSEITQERVKFHEATAADMLERHGPGQYDLVLSHCVAMYLDNPVRGIREAADMVKPGGHLSLMEDGFFGMQARLMADRRPNWQALDQLNRTQRATNNLKRVVYTFKPEELKQVLLATGMEVNDGDWSGVRMVSEGVDMRIEVLSEEERQQLLAMEYEQGHNSDLRAGGQLLHFVVQKPAA